MIKTPVFVLSGFLGSGKTTLLQRLLDECDKQNLTSAVLMNEIGKTDTDGKSISQKSQIIEKLLDGCICCNKKGEVVQSIEKLLKLKPDIIFIELTGVANPEEISDSLTEPALINHVYLDRIITLIDAEHILHYNNLFESDRELVQTTRRQIEVADYLIVNKTDLVNESVKRKINKLINKHNPSSKTSFVTYSKVDVSSLLQNKRSNLIKVKIRMKEDPSDEQTHKHSYTRIKSITLPLTSQTSKNTIESFLKKWKSNLLRAKGYVKTNDGTYLMQVVMKRTYWERTSYKGDDYLVLIGIDLSEEEIKQEWKVISQKISI
jgi:G3E family GTPase